MKILREQQIDKECTNKLLDLLGEKSKKKVEYFDVEKLPQEFKEMDMLK